MAFTEYQKMENNFSKLTVSKEAEKAKWGVFEKIHGANFSFHILVGDNGEKTVKAARRRAFLGENENFFNHRDAEFMKTTPDKMKQVYDDVVKRMPADKDIKSVAVWGEIFGGYYVVDGENLAQNVSCVQREVQYCPKIEWTAFDISYKTAESDAQEFCDYDMAMEILKANGVSYLEPLFVGKMNEALNYDLKFDSTVPKTLGLPALPKGSNIVEGVVAKPMKNLMCENKYGESVRTIVKLKNPGFTEINKPAVKAQKTTKEKKAPKLAGQIMAYATEARLTNAISKHGVPDQDEVVARIIDEFVNDIFVDVKAEDDALQALWSDAPESEKAKIRHSVTAKAKGLIKKINNAR